MLVVTDGAQAAAGDLFATPYSGPGPSGPEIFEPSGSLVWFDPLPGRHRSDQPAGAAARTAAPVLTWWQGASRRRASARAKTSSTTAPTSGSAPCMRATASRPTCTNSASRPRDTAAADRLSTRSTATSSAAGGPRRGRLTDSIFQEIDLKTGLVRREWHGLDHVPLSDSYSSARGAAAQWPFDYLHINSIDQLPSGRTLLSARNTWALYELEHRHRTDRRRDRRQALRPSSSARGPQTAFQHDATRARKRRDQRVRQRRRPRDPPAVARRSCSRSTRERQSDAVVAAVRAPAPLSSGSQGSIQRSSTATCSSGGEPSRTSRNSAPPAQLLYDAHMARLLRVLPRLPLRLGRAPATSPAIAVTTTPPPRPAGPARARRSTRAGTATRALAPGACSPAPRRRTLAPVASPRAPASRPRSTTPGAEPYVAVQALSASGAMLGTSETIGG